MWAVERWKSTFKMWSAFRTSSQILILRGSGAPADVLHEGSGGLATCSHCHLQDTLHFYLPQYLSTDYSLHHFLWRCKLSSTGILISNQLLSSDGRQGKAGRRASVRWWWLQTNGACGTKQAGLREGVCVSWCWEPAAPENLAVQMFRTLIHLATTPSIKSPQTCS